MSPIVATSLTSGFESGKNHPASDTMKGNDSNKIDLKIIDTEKDLGVQMWILTLFRENIIKTVFKANQLERLIRSFQYMNIQIFSLLYQSKVRPIFKYENIIQISRYKKNIDDIENVQRRNTKMVPILNKLSREGRLGANWNYCLFSECFVSFTFKNTFFYQTRLNKDN